MTASQPPAADTQPVTPERPSPAANTRGAQLQAQRQARLNEPPALRYARETRNATVFIAVLAGVVAVIALIGVILAGVQLAKVARDLNAVSTSISNSGSGGSTCESEGGTDPSC